MSKKYNEEKSRVDLWDSARKSFLADKKSPSKARKQLYTKVSKSKVNQVNLPLK